MPPRREIEETPKKQRGSKRVIEVLKEKPVEAPKEVPVETLKVETPLVKAEETSTDRASRLTKDQMDLLEQWQSYQLPTKHSLTDPKKKLEEVKGFLRDGKLDKVKQEIEESKKVYDFVRERNPAKFKELTGNPCSLQ